MTWYGRSIPEQLDAQQQLASHMTQRGGVPEKKALEKAIRTYAGIKAARFGVRVAGLTAIGAGAAVVGLTIFLKREPGIPVLLFFALPLFFGAWQMAQGIAQMSGEGLKHMTPDMLNQLDPFTRALVGLVKSWKGNA